MFVFWDLLVFQTVLKTKAMFLAFWLNVRAAIGQPVEAVTIHLWLATVLDAAPTIRYSWHGMDLKERCESPYRLVFHGEASAGLSSSCTQNGTV